MPGLADIVVSRLRAAGTRAMFGVPGGGGNLDLIDAGRRADLPFVLTSTETGAAIAAMAHADVTGAPGACLTTLGPGAASVVNGIACAFLDRSPILVFTDSNAESAQGRFLHQQLDQNALFAPITKWSGKLTAAQAMQVVDEVFHELDTLPSGPVHLDCPPDVWGEGGHAGNDRNKRFFGSEADISFESPETQRLIAASRKPLLIVGLGSRWADDAAAIRRFCDRCQIPAMVTYKAKGVVPDDHASFAGVFTNATIERPIVEEADLLIGVGLDPVELLPRPWTFTPPIVSINAWNVADDHVPFAAQWVTGIAPALAALEQQVGKCEWDLARVRAQWLKQVQSIEIPARGLSSVQVVDVAARRLAAASRVTIDAGAHMFPATLRWPVREPNGLLISNGLSTMGFALPAAIGAAVADRDVARVKGIAQPEPVVALTGDGGLLMCAGELLTAARERLRIIVIVFVDASLSLIEIKQQARRLPSAGVALGAVDWAKMAESYGATGFSAASEDELGTAIDQALAETGPSLIAVAVDRSNYSDMLRVIRG